MCAHTQIYKGRLICIYISLSVVTMHSSTQTGLEKRKKEKKGATPTQDVLECEMRK